MRSLLRKPLILERYLLREFLGAFVISLLTFTALFLLFDLFERMRTFLREQTTVTQATAYFLFKVPMIVQLMMPIAVLIATIFSVGRLCQLSEVTAMRAGGASVLFLLRPLALCGFVLSLVMFVAGETVVPWSAQRVDELYHREIKKKVLLGTYSRENYWIRKENRFLNIGYYNSRSSTLNDLSILEFDGSFQLKKRIDAPQVVWEGPMIGWVMKEVTEVTFGAGDRMEIEAFPKLPLVISEKPADFYNMKRSPETLSYGALKEYIEKLRSEGVPVTAYLVDLAAKLSFPCVNIVVVLLAFPFALAPARSGTLTRSFLASAALGFGYYFVHALSTSLGSAELIPVLPAAWTANILFLSLAGYLLSGAEFSS